MDRGRRKRRRNKKDVTGGHWAGTLRYIPEEIVLNVLPRLPIKSRGRFRCVSKQWCTWITDDKTRRFKVLIRTEETDIGTYEYQPPTHISFFSIDQNIELETVFQCHEYDNGWSEMRSGKITGSCNGLVLVQVQDGFYLWNPSIDYCSEKLPFPLGDEYFSQYTDFLGLCFDSNNGDYKALLDPSLGTRGPMMVGSFKSKTWTAVNFPYHNCSILTGPVFNDCLHLLANNKYYESYRIVCYDPKEDEFVDVPMPVLTTDDLYEPSLCVLDGCLCMVHNSYKEPYNCEVLVMKEYGVKGSWDVLFKIDQAVKPLFYTHDKEMVLVNFEEEKESSICAYDRNGKFCFDVEVFPSLYESHTSIIVYEETFVKPAW